MKLLKLILTLFIGMAALVSCKNDRKEKAITQSAIASTSKNFALITNPSSGNSALPRLFGTKDKLFMSWIEQKDPISILNFSTLKNGKWSKPVEVSSGSDWFINWADFPAFAENNGNILISHLQNPENGKYTYDVKINLFSAETQTWQKDILLNTDGTASEHGFVSVVPQGNSSFYIIWLDGRNTLAEVGGHETHGGPPMSLRGRLVNANGLMKPDVELDNRVCDCCQTSMTVVDGSPLLVYRDRTDTEVRDISRIGVFDDSFSDPQPVYNDNWKIPGCPVNGPSIASNKNNVVVAWFTAVNDLSMVQVAFSGDGGKTFGMPVQVNKNETLGRVDVVMTSENTAIVSWMENIGNETVIQAMQISPNGTKGFPITISKTTFERAGGFPQLEIAADTLYAAWTNVEGKQSSIKTASIAIKDL